MEKRKEDHACIELLLITELMKQLHAIINNK
jgi:hypothetical protein